MKKNILLVLILSVFVISSCSKQEDKTTSANTTPTPTTKPKIDLLTVGPWKLSAFTIDPSVKRGGVFVTDLYPDVDPWSKDNTRLFIANGSGIEDEGPTKLSPTGPQIIPIVWSFNSDQTKITVTLMYTNQTATNTYDIVKLDESNLKLNLTIDGSKVSGGVWGTTYVYTFSYVH